MTVADVPPVDAAVSGEPDVGATIDERRPLAELYRDLRTSPNGLLLLWGIAFELVFTAAVIYVPPLQGIFDTAALSPTQLAVILPFPVIVWGADELVRWNRRHRGRRADLVTPVG